MSRRRGGVDAERGTVCRARRRVDTERGSGAVLTVALVAVALVLGLGLAVLARAQAGRASAQTAADLAALAAARSIALPPGLVLEGTAAGRGHGPSDDVGPCALAATVAGRNGADLTSCAVLADGSVQVSTERRLSVGTAAADARAGPGWLRRVPP